MFVIHINFGGCTIMPTSCWVEDGEALHWRQNERSFPQEWSYIESCQSQSCLAIERCHFWLLSKKKSLYQNAITEKNIQYPNAPCMEYLPTFGSNLW